MLLPPVHLLGAARCREVRDAIRDAYGDVGGHCVEASVLLAHLLNRDGVAARARAGAYRFRHPRLGEVSAPHWCVEAGPLLLDPTVEQFPQAGWMIAPRADPHGPWQPDRDGRWVGAGDTAQLRRFLAAESLQPAGLARVCRELGCRELAPAI